MSESKEIPDALAEAAREVRRQFDLVVSRERERVESLRSEKVIPHARGEDRS